MNMVTMKQILGFIEAKSLVLFCLLSVNILLFVVTASINSPVIEIKIEFFKDYWYSQW